MTTRVSKFSILWSPLFIPGLVFAQHGKLRGKVTDAQTNDPLPGADVFVEGTSLGASTDLDGTLSSLQSHLVCIPSVPTSLAIKPNRS